MTWIWLIVLAIATITALCVGGIVGAAIGRNCDLQALRTHIEMQKYKTLAITDKNVDYLNGYEAAMDDVIRMLGD